MSLPLDRAARRVLSNDEDRRRHAAAVSDLRRRRDLAVGALEEFEALRAHASSLRRHALDHLDLLLERFEERARAAGACVHFARDAVTHNRIVHALLAERGVRRVVKSKSMLTEECGLNAYLEARGVEVVDTDLGERIVQLGREAPSHIVAPAIHKRREEVGELFHRTLGSREGEADPAALSEIARRDLRRRFLEAEAGITGVNFAIAETGSVVICTNEGNADLGIHLPPLHVACVGIEKLLPRVEDLPTLLRLLARSATGQRVTAYTTFLTGPRRGAELHVVFVDNGRSRLLADPAHREALACIRCGACLNTCPVYRQSGGHAYGQTLPGPIGAVLAPALRDDEAGRALPFASSLCGSCAAVCPVGIDLHGQLLAWRARWPYARGGAGAAARVAAAVLARPALLRIAGRVARAAWPLLKRRWPGNPLGAWLEGRALPAHPGPSFRALHGRRLAGSPGRASPAVERDEGRSGCASGERPGRGRAPAPKGSTDTDRTWVLDAARRACDHSLSHPGPYAPPVKSPEWSDLASRLREAGGTPHGPVDAARLATSLASICGRYGGGPLRADVSIPHLTLAEGWEAVVPEATGNPLADTHVLVARGIVGVTENGAVAVALPEGVLRGALFLCEHLVLVLDADALEPDLHLGLARLSRSLPRGASHVWVSGPSKTADIEQTLVLGAHGPRTLDLVGVRRSTR